MKIEITNDDLKSVQDYLRSARLTSSINSIDDCQPVDGEAVYYNTGEKWGDGYFYVPSELPGMITSCGWEDTAPDDILADGIEVPAAALALVWMKPKMKLTQWESEIESADSVADLELREFEWADGVDGAAELARLGLKIAPAA